MAEAKKKLLYPVISFLAVLGVELSPIESWMLSIMAWGIAIILTIYVGWNYIIKAINSYLIYSKEKFGASMTYIVFGLIVGCLAGGGLYTYDKFLMKDGVIKTEQFSWSWDALTEDQSKLLVLKLIPVETELHIYSIAPSSRSLAKSLDEVFESAKWKHHLRMGPPVVGMGEGIIVGPDGDAAEMIKKNIEKITSLKVSIKNLQGMIADSLTYIVIGTKPIPSPIPPELKKEITAFGQKLKEISADIMVFATDRKREKTLLPPRENYPDDEKGAHQWWQRGVDFSNETESLYNSKFGNLANQYIIRLRNMGIALPFSLISAESSPKRLSFWFSAIGDLLIDVKIEEARVVGNSEDLWFRVR